MLMMGNTAFSDVGLLSGRYYGETKEGKPHGKGKLITNFQEVIQLLENSIDNYEETYKKQWDSLPKE